MTVGLIPGSFDPFHNGHLEIVERASQIFDEVVVAAIRNPQKSEPLFDLDERREMIADSLAHVPNVRIVSISTLLVNVARDVNATAIVKGLRAVSDFEELELADGPDEPLALGRGDPLFALELPSLLHCLAAPS